MSVINILLLLILIPSIYYCNNVQTNLVIAFVKKDKFPTTVTAFLDWDRNEISYFVRSLADNSIASYINTRPDYSVPIFEEHEHQLFVLDMNIPKLQHVLLQANNSYLFAMPYRWILLNVNDTNIKILTCFNILLNSKVYIIKSTIDTCEINSIYKLYQNSTEFSTNNIASWNNNKSDFSYFNQLIIIRNRTNLFGKGLTIAYVILKADSLEHLWDLRFKRVDAVTKISMILLGYIAENLNLSKILRKHKDWIGKKGKDNFYTGMIGDLQRKTADAAGTVVFMTKDRVASIDFVAITTPAKGFFIFRQPSLSLVGNIYLLTFENTIWYATFALIFTTTCIIYATLYWDRINPNNETNTEEKPRVLELVLFQIQAVCQQGFETVPRCLSGRIAIIFTLISFMFLYNSFSANIVALLQSTSNSIQSLEDVLNSRIKLGVENTEYNRYYFSLEKEPLKKTIYERKIVPPGQPSAFMSVEVGIEKVRTEFFAFYGETISAYDLIQRTYKDHEKCGLQQIKFLQFPYPWNIISKNSTYKEYIQTGFRHMSETGIQSRVLSHFFTQIPECNKNSGNFVTVGIIESYFMFLIFGSGVVLSCILLIFENLIYIYNQKKQKW